MCRDCRSEAKRQRRQLDCERCGQGRPRLDDLDEAALWIAGRIRAAAYDGLGGVNGAIADSAVRRFAGDYSSEAQTEIWVRLIEYLAVKSRGKTANG